MIYMTVKKIKLLTRNKSITMQSKGYHNITQRKTKTKLCNTKKGPQMKSYTKMLRSVIYFPDYTLIYEKI